MLSAAPLNQGIVQGSFGSAGIQCGLLNFKAELNPMNKRKVDIFYSCLVSQLCFHKEAHSLVCAFKCVDFEINYSNVALTLVVLCAVCALLFM